MRYVGLAGPETVAAGNDCQDGGGPGLCVSRINRSRFFSHCVHVLQVACDFLIFVAAALLADLPYNNAGAESFRGRFTASVIATVVSVTTINLLILPQQRSIQPFFENLRSTMIAVGLGGVSAMAGLALLGITTVAMWQWLATWAFALIILRPMGIILSKRIAQFLVGHDRTIQSIAVVGVGDCGEALCKQLKGCGDSGIRFAGLYCDCDEDALGMPSMPIVGRINDLIESSRWSRIDTVVLALPQADLGRVSQIREKLRSLAVDIYVTLDILELACGGYPVNRLGGSPVFKIDTPPLTVAQDMWKSVFDVAVASVLLFIALPLLVTIGLAIKLSSPGPIFFRQPRRGINNSMFNIYKFRTMYHHLSDIKADEQTKREDPRVTGVGRWLRRTSLDELPQLFNVLKGEMSLIGPRPHAPNTKAGAQYFHEAVKDYSLRYRVRPGMTGWAQVNGWRGETETIDQIENRVAHDLHYINNWSFYFDAKILGLTVFRGFLNKSAF